MYRSVTLPALPTTFAEFDALPLLGAAVEDDGTVIVLNALGARRLGWPIGAIVGRKAWEFAPGMEHVWAERLAASRAVGWRHVRDRDLDAGRCARGRAPRRDGRNFDGQRCVFALAVAVQPLVQSLRSAKKLPTTETEDDFCRRFVPPDIELLMTIVNDVRVGSWLQQAATFFAQPAWIDADGSTVETTGDEAGHGPVAHRVVGASPHGGLVDERGEPSAAPLD